MVNKVTRRTIFALNMQKSNVLVVDVDEKKMVKMVNMVKHLGVAGYREEFYWMMTKRSTGQLHRQCNLLPHTYRYVDFVPASLSSDIIQKIERQNVPIFNLSHDVSTGM